MRKVDPTGSVPDMSWNVLGQDCSRLDFTFFGTVSLELMIFTLPLKKNKET